MLVDTKNAPAISLGISHSLRGEPNAGAWVCARPARSSIAFDYIDCGRVVRGMDVRPTGNAWVGDRERCQLGPGAMGIALRTARFTHDRRRLLCAQYDKAGTTNRLDCIRGASRNCIPH